MAKSLNRPDSDLLLFCTLSFFFFALLGIWSSHFYLMRTLKLKEILLNPDGNLSSLMLYMKLNSKNNLQCQDL